MNQGYFSYPIPVNEPILSYGPGTAERAALKKTLAELKSQQADIPMYIGSKEVRTGKLQPIFPAS
jgi:1-pyrroline-5-carboxylate dehydrogenase